MAKKTTKTVTAAAPTANVEATVKTKKAAAPAKAVKATKPAEPIITFGSWVARAKARADKNDEAALPLLIELKGDKKITVDAKLVNVKKRYGDKPGFATIEARYMSANAIAIRAQKAA